MNKPDWNSPKGQELIRLLKADIFVQEYMSAIINTGDPSNKFIGAKLSNPIQVIGEKRALMYRLWLEFGETNWPASSERGTKDVAQLLRNSQTVFLTNEMWDIVIELENKILEHKKSHPGTVMRSLPFPILWVSVASGAKFFLDAEETQAVEMDSFLLVDKTFKKLPGQYLAFGFNGAECKTYLIAQPPQTLWRLM